MNGLERIAGTFAHARRERRAALMPYYTLGYPDPDTSLQVVRAIAGNGADLIELGIPFSDPLADGPTIQRSTQRALEQGMTVERCLNMVAGLRAEGVEQPLLLMGYYNPILSYGTARFVNAAAVAGADGFIVPDLPPEEAGEMEMAARAAGCATVFLLAPTSNPERAAAVAMHSTGFLYLVTQAGTTGAREHLPPDLASFVRRTREITSLPLAVGFGISTPAEVLEAGALADGVIVGSALLDAVAGSTSPVAAAATFVRQLAPARLHSQ